MSLDISPSAEFRLGRDDLHGYQAEAVDLAQQLKKLLFFIDTGLGKCGIVLTLIDRLMVAAEMGHRVLIVAPVRVASSTWTNEMQEWRHASWLHDLTTVLRVDDDDPEVKEAGRKAYAAWSWIDRKDAEQARGKAETEKKHEILRRKAADGNLVHTINREAFPWLVQQYGSFQRVKKSGKTRKRFVLDKDRWPYSVIVLDESTSFGDYTSQRFKYLVSMLDQTDKVEYLIPMTATPAADGYEKVFAMTYIVDRGERLGRNITAFRNEFYRPHPKIRFKYEMIAGSEQKISDRIADISIVMKEEDYSEDRTPLFLPRVIDLTESEQKQYNKFKREAVMSVGDDILISADNAASLSSKLLQLAAGAIYDAEGRTHNIHDHALDDLAELQEELQGSPILVAYWYKSSLAKLRKRFPQGKVIDSEGRLFDGRNSDWNRGKIPLLFVHPASVAHGLNGQYGPGHDIYMYDGCWSYEYYYQLWRRLARQGQKKRVRVHQRKTRGTLDFLLYDKIDAKEDAQDILFETVRQYWRQNRGKGS